MRNRLYARPFRVLSAVTLTVVMGVCPPALSQDEPAAPGDEATGFVDGLYSKRIEAVQRTRPTDDDTALMTEMLDIAPTLPKTPDARSVLYVRVIDMASRVNAGYDLALRSLELLQKHNPSHPSAGPDARLNLYGSWYRAADRDARKSVAEVYFDHLLVAAESAMQAGDVDTAKQWYNEAGTVHRVNRLERNFDLREKLGQVRALERMQEEIARLQAAATAKAITPDQARRLVVLLALERDRYEEAKSYASLVQNAEFAKGLEAAAAIGGKAATADPGDHPPGHWFEAGTWYAALIDEPGLSEPVVKQTMELAILGLRVYVETTTKDTIEKARAAILLRQLDERYTTAYGPKFDEKDVIRLLDPGKHMIYTDNSKLFEVKDKQLHVKEKMIVHLPVKATGSYQLTLKVKPLKHRTDGLLVWLPVHGRIIRMGVDVADSHISRFDGFKSEGQFDESNGAIRLERDKVMTVQVSVKPLPDRRVAIQVSVDGKAVWNYEDTVDKFETPGYGLPPDTSSFSISMKTDAVFEEILFTSITEKK